MRFFRFNTIKTALLTASALATYHIYDVKTSPSQFESAAEGLHIGSDQQKALLKIFTMSGYFEKQKAWEDIYRSKIFKDDTRSVFTGKVYPVIYKSGADKQNPNEVDIEYLKHELFGRSKQYFWQKSDITQEQVEDWILYVSQNAYNRKEGQERNELTAHDWMTDYKEEYLAAAKVLGLIDRIDPPRSEYDEAWIAGASRPALLARAMDYNWILNHGVKITGDSKVLAGARPLWAQIDGMNPDILEQMKQGVKDGAKVDDIKVIIATKTDQARTEEGIEYIKSLAQKHGILLKPEAPVIQYNNKEECPTGLFPGRTYPNYADPNGPKLDESKMSKDMLDLVLGKNEVYIVDTLSQNNQRPNTETTTRDAVKKLISQIQSGKYEKQLIFHILFVSNNPYIERQALAAQRVANDEFKKAGVTEKGYSIIIDGVGFRCKQDVTAASSESALLMFEKWKANPDNADRPFDHLVDQTRDKTSIVPFLGGIDDID